MSDSDDLRQQVRKRMTEDGIPVGTDDPTLLALGAKPLMPQVECNLKPSPEDCVCGCGETGQLRVRSYRDGSTHVRPCRCNRCRGRTSREKGRKGQAAAARALGIPRSNLSPGHEEFLPGTVRMEHKQGNQVARLISLYRASRAQSEAARPFGDHRPFVATFGHDGLEVAVIDLDHLADAVAALAEQLGMT